MTSQARDDESQDTATIPGPGARIFVEVCRCWSRHGVLYTYSCSIHGEACPVCLGALGDTSFCPCCEQWNAGIAPDGSAVTE